MSPFSCRLELISVLLVLPQRELSPFLLLSYLLLEPATKIGVNYRVSFEASEIIISEEVNDVFCFRPRSFLPLVRLPQFGGRQYVSVLEERPEALDPFPRGGFVGAFEIQRPFFCDDAAYGATSMSIKR